jgi:membrane-associated protease RseP (regulator of RpoE activity)
MDWKKTLSTVAPGLATMLGGPLAGMATTAIMGYFGIESTGDPGQDEALLAQKVVGMTPADAIELKKIEANLAIELKKADIDIYKIEVEDRTSARAMREKLGGDYLSALIAVLVVVGWAVISYSLFTAVTELPNKDILLRGMGTLDAALMCVLYFLFGSSRGSQLKDERKANSK